MELNKKLKTLVDLTNGKKPRTPKEKELARQIKAIKDKGMIVEIPGEIP